MAADRKVTVRFTFFCVFLSATCVVGQSPFPKHGDRPPPEYRKAAGSDSAVALLDQALELMKNNYYQKDLVHWDSVVARAKMNLAQASGCTEVYGIISSCFREMNASHSFIMAAGRSALYENDSSALQRKPQMREWLGEIRAEMPDQDIAYLSLPWVFTTDPALCTLIADSLQNLIKSLDQQGIAKWIIDLRKNKGGNCWPMLAGIGPLIEDPVCCYFVLSSGKKSVSYSDGRALYGSQSLCSISGSPYKTKIAKKTIAILIGPETSSSGETLALAFKGLPNTAFFGEPTAGFTTVNTTYQLLDHSMLVLTVSKEAGRNGQILEGKIIPDEIVTANPSFPSHDPVRDAALMWLQLF